ncbi:MAG TPA: hypothetical protein VHR18_06275 [Solirubrobacterales bacterium]|jgi:hypothetical protein|nr:hypothetical protein [Solirubrobacterales bacterium]
MAQTKKRRKGKKRGTQGGRIDTKARGGRPRSREEAKARARSKKGKAPAQRVDKIPTWRSSIVRGLFAAVIFFVLLILLFKRPVGTALAFGGFMLAFYIPAGYYIDMAMWRRRERARIRAREQQ